MKKKLLTLFLAVVLVLNNSALAFAAESLSEPTEMANAIPTATGKEAIAALSATDSVVIDLRAAEDYEAAHIKGSVSLPVCQKDYSVTTTQRDNFVNYVKNNIDSSKKVYLVCYVGTFCVNFAAKWLTDPVDANGCGFAANNLYRVTGGVWNDADLAAACNSTHYDYALAADGIILDVRSTTNFFKGFVDGSLHQPLFDDNGVTTGSDKLATDFTAFVNANKELLSSKNIYVLCNSGARGAQNATALLNAAGIKNVFTIENGAKSDISKQFVTCNSVDGKTAVAATKDNGIVIIDVRTVENYGNGHLPGSISMPLFDANGVTSCSDKLAMDFLAAVKANAGSFAGKDIYILCNSGARGAQSATRLLMQAGYSNADIFTITGGAKDADVKAAFVKDVVIDEYNKVSGSDAVNADAEKVFVIDVRTEANHAKGSLAGSVNWPLFNANGVSNCEDALADAFLANVSANADKLAGKDIYILCNSGARGAQAATKLLVEAGYSNDDIFTITNGAKGIEVRHAFLVNANGGKNPTTPVTSEQALEAVGNENIVILDVRASGNYGAGHLKGAVSQPLFDSKGVVQTADDALAKAFVEYAKTSLVTVAKAAGEKEIYVLCNSGQSGARAATVLLNDAGVDLSRVHTITGGYNKNEDIKEAATYVSDSRAVNATQEKDVVIIDVRSADKYEAGHLANSISLPLFDKDNNLPDDLAEAFTAYIKANAKAFEGKKVYILCNSGSRGAAKATELFEKAEIKTSVFTIEGGAKSALIQQYFVTDTEPSNPSGTPDTGDTSNVMLYALLMGLSLLAVLTVRKREYNK